MSAHSSSTAVSAPKGWGSFQSPSVEFLIHQSESEYQPPTLPAFVTQLDIPNELLLQSEKQNAQATSASVSTCDSCDHPAPPASTEATPSSHHQSAPSPPSSPFGRSLLSKLYHIEPEWTFINHGAFGGTLKPLLNVRNSWSIQMEKQPLRFIDRELLPTMVETMRQVAKMVGAPATSVSLHNNVTTALNIILKSFPFPKTGGKVLRLNLTYGAVKKMIDALQGVELVEVAVPLPLQSRKVLLSLVEESLKQHSQSGAGFHLAVFDHISSNSGIKLPMKELIDLCHAYNVPVLIDGAHSWGSVVSLDLFNSNVDFFVTNAHKWCCNPKGAAMMYVSEKFQKTIKSLIVSHGTGAGYTSDFAWTGCQDYGSILTLTSMIEFWRRVGLQRSIEYSHGLVLQAARMLRDRWGTELLIGGGNVEEEEALSANMVCVRLPGPLDPLHSDEHNEIQAKLHFEHHIEAPIKTLGTPIRLYVRISGMIYNEMADYVRLAEAIENIRGGKQQTVSEVANQPTSTATATTSASTTTDGKDYFSTLPVRPVDKFPVSILAKDHTQVCIPPNAEAQAREYYIGVLGMREVQKPSELLTRGGFWLYCGSDAASNPAPHANVHIGTEDLPKDFYSKTKAHIAYQVQNLKGWYEKLSRLGYPTIPGVSVKGMERFDTRDPFGNKVEMIEYDDPKKKGPLAAAAAAASVSHGAPASSASSIAVASVANPPLHVATSNIASAGLDETIEVETKDYFWRSARAYEKKPLLSVGVLQCASFNGDIRGNLDLLRSQLELARSKQVQLVLAPELFLTGYAIDREATHRLAQEQNGEVMKEVCSMAKEFSVAVCIGYPELVVNPSTPISPSASDCGCCNPLERRAVYNSAILISDTGDILLNYRKTHLWEVVEKSFFTPGPEDELKVCEYKGITIGMNICYDVEFNEPSRILALLGCQLLLVPTALAKAENLNETIPMKVVPTRALDNHVWILYSNHVGPSYKDAIFCGLSAIIGPDGEDLARADDNPDKPQLLTAQLIPGDFARAFERTPLLVDRRAELFGNISKNIQWK